MLRFTIILAKPSSKLDWSWLEQLEHIYPSTPRPSNHVPSPRQGLFPRPLRYSQIYYGTCYLRALRSSKQTP